MSRADVSHLTLRSLRQQLALLEAAPASALDADAESDLPLMHTLRSPTTRTFTAIVQNKQSFAAIEAFLLEAEEERRTTQELIDAAEEVRAMPLSAAFESAARDSLERGEGITFRLPRDAAGKILSPEVERSVLLMRDPERDEDDGHDGAAAPPPPPPPPCAARDAEPRVRGSAVVAEPAFMLPPPQAGSDAAAQRTGTAHEDGRGALRRLLEEQRQLIHECTRGASRTRYEQMMNAHRRWEQQRMDAFDVLLRSDAAPGGSGGKDIQATDAHEP